jgi:hypothetical protein
VPDITQTGYARNIRVVSSIASAGSEIAYITAGTRVFAEDDQKWYRYDGSTWIEVTDMYPAPQALTGGAGIAVAGATINQDNAKILLRRPGQVDVEYADPAAACAAAQSGDLVVLPAGSLAGFSIPDGVTVVGQGAATVIAGTVDGPASGTAYLSHCKVNTPSSAAVRVNAGDVVLWDCDIYGKYGFLCSGAGAPCMYFGTLGAEVHKVAQGVDESVVRAINSWDADFSQLIEEYYRTSGTPDWNVAGTDTIDFYLLKGMEPNSTTGGYFTLDLGQVQAGGSVAVRVYHSNAIGDSNSKLYASVDGVNWALRAESIGQFGSIWETLSGSLAGYRYVRYRCCNGNGGYECDIGVAYVQLQSVTASTITAAGDRLQTYGVAGGESGVIPLLGDRSAYDVANFGTRHASDWAAGDSHHPAISLGAGSDPLLTLDAGGQVLTLGDVAAQADLAAHTGDSTNPHGVTKAQVGLGNVPDLKVNLEAITAPTATDDSGDGYAVGSRWLDTTADKEYVCADATAGAAVWVETTGGGGGAFTDLTDAPADYSGDAGKLVRVKATEDGLEFITPPAGTGDVVGPASAVDGHLAVFDGATGKLLRDGGAVPAGGSGDLAPALKVYLNSNFK